MAATRKKEREKKRNHCAIELIHFHCHYPFEWPIYIYIYTISLENGVLKYYPGCYIIFFILVSIPYHFNPNPMQLYLWEHRTYYLLAIVCCLEASWFNFIFTPPFSNLTHKHTHNIYSNVLRWLFSQISITFILVLLSFFFY